MICPLCGLTAPENGICEHHAYADIDAWAAANRIMCDFFHRKRVPERLPPEERGRVEVEV